MTNQSDIQDYFETQIVRKSPLACLQSPAVLVTLYGRFKMLESMLT